MATTNNPLAAFFQLMRAYPIPILLTIVALRLLFNKYGTGLSHIPGPPLASFTGLWRVNEVRKGKAHERIISLHRKYGKLVRIGPKVVDISDPAMIPLIYNIKGNFLKVRYTPHPG